ncbi:MAG: DNA repair protein RecO [Clostridia bacterium]
MATIKIKGIVIAENNMGDYDKMLTILTPNLGKISCSAKGARKPKSALLAGTQLFCFCDYLMYQGTSTYHINSSETIEMFYNIRTDLDKLKYAIHLNKIVQDITEENENCYNILQLYLNALYSISETDKDKDLIISIFKLRLLKILGFTPRINECVNCREKNNLNHFSIKDNGFKCEPCSRQDKSAISISESTKNAIIYTIGASPKKVFSFNLKNESLEEFKLVSKIYFDEKMEKVYGLEEIF